MRYDDQLDSLRRDLDELLRRAATLKDRIAAVEREIELDSRVGARGAASGEDLAARVGTEPQTPSAVPPPLPPVAEGPRPAREAIPVASVAKTPHPAPPEFIPQTGPSQKTEVRPPSETALPGASFEERIWKYWMPRVAGVLLAIGIAWVLYLVGPHLPKWTRVAFGYAVAGALIGTAWKLERNYLQYARVLYGTAIGVSYFVSFAAHYISAARIIESEGAGIALLVTVVVLWGIVAQVRQSRIVATLVTLLGHLTMGLAFFTTGELARYSIAGVAILGLGSAFFLLYNRWYYIAVVGLVGCYANHALWTFHFLGTTPIPPFRLSFGFLWVYMLTFALAELFCAEELRRETISTRFRAFFVSLNTVCFFALGTLTSMRYEKMFAHRDQFLLAYSLVLGLIGLGYLRLRAADPLYNAYLTKAVSAFTLFLAVRYGQGTLTASLAVESVVLLYSSRRSGLVVTRLLAFGAAALCVAHAIYTAIALGVVPAPDPRYWRRVIESSFAVVGMFAASQLYQRTDWSPRAPKSLPFSRAALLWMWEQDLVADLPKGFEGRRKPYGGLQFPYIYALFGLIVFSACDWMLMHERHRVTAFATFVLVMTIAAYALQARPFSLVAMMALAPSLLGTIWYAALKNDDPAWLAWVTVSLIAAAAVFADRRIIGEREGLAFQQMRASPYLLYCTATLMLSMAIVMHGQTNLQRTLYFAVAAAISTVLIVVLHRRALATATLISLAFGALTWMVVTREVGWGQWHATGLAMIAACIFADRFFSHGGKDEALVPWASVALCFTWPQVYLYVGKLGKEPWWFEQASRTTAENTGYQGFGFYPVDWVAFVLAIVSFAYAGYTVLTRSRVSTGLAVVNAVIVSTVLVGISHQSGNTMATLPMVCGYVALAGFWVLGERFATRARSAKLQQLVNVFCAFCAGSAALLLVLMVERVPSVSKYYLTLGWGTLAIALFGISLATWQRFYRYAGLGVFLLAIARLFYDVRDLQGIYRPLAFIGLAMLLLIVSFGYYYASRLIDSRKPGANVGEMKPGGSGPPPIS